MHSKILIEGSYAASKASIGRLYKSLVTAAKDPGLPEPIRDVVKMWAEECKNFNLKHFDDRDSQRLKGDIANVQRLADEFEEMTDEGGWSNIAFYFIKPTDYKSALEDLNIDTTDIAEFTGSEIEVTIPTDFLVARDADEDDEGKRSTIVIITPVGYVLRDEAQDFKLYPSLEDLKKGLEGLGWGLGPDADPYA